MIRNHLSRWNQPTHYLHFMPWTSNYIQVYDIFFPNSWTVPIELVPSSSNIWWWLPHWTSMTWGLVAQRLGMDWSVGGGMKVGLGQDETFVDVVVCKRSLVGKNLGLCHYFESLERHHAPTKSLGPIICLIHNQILNNGRFCDHDPITSTSSQTNCIQLSWFVMWLCHMFVSSLMLISGPLRQLPERSVDSAMQGTPEQSWNSFFHCLSLVPTLGTSWPTSQKSNMKAENEPPWQGIFYNSALLDWLFVFGCTIWRQRVFCKLLGKVWYF